VVDYVAAQSISEMGDIHIGFQQLIDGRQDHEQRWKRCVEVLSRHLPFAIGAAYIERFITADAKASAVRLFNNIKEEFVELITNTEWIDESTRGKLLNKLKSLVPLIAYPDRGFDEQAINELYEDIKPDKGQYLTTLFQLRVIDADTKLRQLYTSSSEEWSRFLSPTDVTAAYSPSDNTLRTSTENCHKFRLILCSLSKDSRLACCNWLRALLAP
jgi:predicted metalloendopeptidase